VAAHAVKRAEGEEVKNAKGTKKEHSAAVVHLHRFCASVPSLLREWTREWTSVGASFALCFFLFSLELQEDLSWLDD